MDVREFSCADCRIQSCGKASDSYPEFCPTAAMDEEAKEAVAQRYEDDPLALQVMQAAAETSSKAFREHWTRVEDTLEFFRQMGWSRIGLASCSVLAREASIYANILRAHGFEPFGVACKVGSIPKERFNAVQSTCSYGAMSCNPILQAQLLADEKTDVNVIIGLCVGHDMLFNRYSEAPVTTLIAKDRALLHNPAAALYATEAPLYYDHLLHPKDSD